MAERERLTKNDLEVIEDCAKTLRNSPALPTAAAHDSDVPDPDDIAALIAKRRAGEQS
jgi:hypothetical protein